VAVAEYTIDIPAADEWLSTNHRWHWAKRAKTTRAWRHATCWRTVAAKLPRLTGRVAITATIHRTDTRRADAHNRLPTIKAAIDGVVDAGLIRDDSDQFIASLTILAGAPVSRAEHPRGVLRLTITEVP
jgi:crossover junction endodeoxyribonuclease RusA